MELIEPAASLDVLCRENVKSSDPIETQFRKSRAPSICSYQFGKVKIRFTYVWTSSFVSIQFSSLVIFESRPTTRGARTKRENLTLSRILHPEQNLPGVYITPSILIAQIFLREWLFSEDNYPCQPPFTSCSPRDLCFNILIPSGDSISISTSPETVITAQMSKISK